jgi:ketosteroid isomerase-like protein
MSQENVEIVRRVTERFNSGEPSWDLVDPEIEWVVEPPAWVAGTYRGHDGVRTLLSRLEEVFERVRMEVDQYLDGGDVVVTLGRMEVRGVLSGVPTGQPVAQLVWVRDGRVVAVRGNLPPEDALEAAGLRE